MIKNFMAQFENPQGPLGYIVGLMLLYENRTRNAWAVSQINIQPDDHVLEIGFGPGDAIQKVCAINSSGFTAGIDHSQLMVSQALKRNAGPAREGRLELSEGSAMALPYGDARFDKAFAINSLHIWPDAVKGLQEMRRVLKPNGLLAIVEQPRTALTQAALTDFIEERSRLMSQVGLRQIRIEMRPMKPAPTVAWIGTN